MSGGGAQPLQVARGEGQSVRNPVTTGAPLEIKARGEETGGALTAFESTAAPGEGPPLHKHENEDEVMYFLDGPFRLRIGDDVRDAPPDSFAFVPRETAHTWQNVGSDRARLFAIFTPAAPGMEWFFERFAELADDGSVAEAFAALAEEAGMTVLGPPLGESHPLP